MLLPAGKRDASGFASSSIFWGNNVKWFDNKWNVLIDTPEMKPRVIESLNFYKKMSNYIPPGFERADFGELLSYFTTGKVAMSVYCGRLCHHIETNAPQLADKIYVQGFPTPDGKPEDGEGGFVGAGNFGYDHWLLYQGPAVKEAHELLRYLATEAYIDYVNTLPVHYEPVTHKFYNDSRYQNHPLVVKYKQAVQTLYKVRMKGRVDNVALQGPEPPHPLLTSVFSEYA
ncbi:MAG: extracellular solute-binding protein [Nitrososphaeria archaeon]